MVMWLLPTFGSFHISHLFALILGAGSIVFSTCPSVSVRVRWRHFRRLPVTRLLWFLFLAFCLQCFETVDSLQCFDTVGWAAGRAFGL